MDYYTFITAAVQNRWNLWNVRGFMILSLCMQLILSIAAPLRQKTSNRFVIFLVWSSYLMADWSALFVFGLISNSASTNSGNNDADVPLDIMALWAGFLLVHLGGPDAITAFSLEDNALWLRHLVGLVAQLSVFLYIFMKTLPNNRLLVPTGLIFVAGMINYGERTRALYLASLEHQKTKSIEKTTVLNLTKEEKTFHQIAYGLVNDIMPDLQEYNESRDLILKYNTEETFRSIKSELNVLYELLYTKAKAATSNWGILARGIMYYSTQVAFILFCLADKHGFRGVDLAITYALFVGVFVLHVANTMMLGTTDSRDFEGMQTARLALEQGIFPVLLIVALGLVLAKLNQFTAIHNIFYRRWSEKMGYLNMLSQCFKQCRPRRGCKLGFIWNKLVGERRTHRGTICEDIIPVRERHTPRGTMCEDITLVGERRMPRGTMCEDITLVGERRMPRGTMCEDITLVEERHTPMETTCEGITLVGERQTPMGAMCEDKILVGERQTPMETTCEGITLDGESLLLMPGGTMCEDITLVGERRTPRGTMCEDITLVGERPTPIETICEGITLVGERHKSESVLGSMCKNKIPDTHKLEKSMLDDAMWNSVCEDIKGKAAGPFVAARMRELYEARGDRALEEINCRELMTYIRDFEYENTLLIWHIATAICINIEGEEDNVDHSDWKRKRKLSKKLSDYLMYLLVRQPKLMSAVAGISQIRYNDTCVELKCLGRRFGSPTMRKFCASIVQEYANKTESSNEGTNHVQSVLKDSCGLVQLLRQRGQDNRWDAIHKVWLELLSYAAGHCRVGSHLRLLSEGGEFLTFVWMLMAFCGIRDQLPVK